MSNVGNVNERHVLTNLRASKRVRYLRLIFCRLRHGQISFSQEGEDILLKRIFGSKTIFYVDVGAHHPRRFSNTYWAYLEGGRGICIDGTPGFKKKFVKHRPRDYVVEVCVGKQESVSKLYIFSDAALNTTLQSRAEELIKNTSYTCVKTSDVQQRTLDSIIDEYVHKFGFKEIDLLSVDTEGTDLEVIQSLNFTKYRPRYVIIEILNKRFDSLFENNVVTEMSRNNYEIVSILFNSVLFKSKTLVEILNQNEC